MNYVSMGTTIRILRRSLKWNLKTLGDRAGISVSFLSLIEDDKRSPSLESVGKIATAMGVPPEVILLPAKEGKGLSCKDQHVTNMIKLVREVVDAERVLAVSMKILDQNS
jgi:transcriptional regulator with XRE-family HTH domain